MQKTQAASALNHPNICHHLRNWRIRRPHPSWSCEFLDARHSSSTPSPAVLYALVIFFFFLPNEALSLRTFQMTTLRDRLTPKAIIHRRHQARQPFGIPAAQAKILDLDFAFAKTKSLPNPSLPPANPRPDRSGKDDAITRSTPDNLTARAKKNAMEKR